MAGQHPYYGEADFLHPHEEAGGVGGGMGALHASLSFPSVGGCVGMPSSMHGTCPNRKDRPHTGR